MTTTLNPTLTITVSGPTGSGKSRVLAVIADVLKLIHSDCIIDAPDVKAEKAMCGEDHTAWHRPRSGTLFKLEEVNQPVNTGRCITTPVTVEDLHDRPVPEPVQALMRKLGISFDEYQETSLQPVVDLVNWALTTQPLKSDVKKIPGLPLRTTLRLRSAMEGYHGLGEWDDTQVWIEPGYKPELRISLSTAFAGYLQRDREGFWVPLFCPDGHALGWIKFSATDRIHGHFHFSATEFRAAAEPAPKMGDLVAEGIHWPAPESEKPD
ncbi:TPA: hypothetical protein I8Y21_004429 [Klebsiella oxytoca]|uniref:Uncharacterized protein n=1 Tax=Klebsiella oxytoca TaxID=571 RepID=A0AAN5RFP8_KLEOX|nr:hypothetical protein [Klebsiella oxytoca]